MGLARKVGAGALGVGRSGGVQLIANPVLGGACRAGCDGTLGLVDWICAIFYLAFIHRRFFSGSGAIGADRGQPDCEPCGRGGYRH